MSLVDSREEIEEEWMLVGLCNQTDPEIFFPDIGESMSPAKRVCAGCDVRERCLEYAIRNHERFGVWGGKSPDERRRLRGAHRG